MTAGLVSSQFLMYSYIKQALGARPGIEIHKEETQPDGKPTEPVR
jgi:solute carrier family 25 phosphate transporter 3